jgi:hypothetical protein
MSGTGFVFQEGKEVTAGAAKDQDFVAADGELLDDGGDSTLAFIEGRGLGRTYPEPVGRWTLDSETGVADVVGTNDGTNNGVNLGVSGPTAGTEAGAFAPSGDTSVSDGDYVMLDDGYSEQAFTVTVWAYLDGTPWDNLQVCEQNNAGGDIWHIEYSVTNGGMKYRIRWGTSTGSRATISPSFPIGEWVFIAFVHTGSKMLAYHDGSEVASAGTNGIVSGSPAMGIGVNTSEGSPSTPENDSYQFWDGRLADLRYHDVAFTQGEVQRLMDSY